MKRQLFLGTLIVAFGLAATIAQDNSPAAQDVENRFQRLSSRIDDLEVSFQRFQKDLDKLESEIRGLRDQVSRVADNAGNAANQESIKRLADAIEEVDRKRVKHQENVDSALREMEKLIVKGSGSGSRNGSSKPPSNPPPEPRTGGKGYDYTVRANDNPTNIAAALREQKGLKITAAQIIAANPGVDWTRLKIGQKIFIPDPSAP
jgi:F0F1-type ATP synthase membrane subunit b/b'